MATPLENLLLALVTGRVWGEHTGGGMIPSKFDIWDYTPGVRLVCDYLGVDWDEVLRKMEVVDDTAICVR